MTAQTLLIHVPDRTAVLREMLRVLRPGGLLWLVEPNNLANASTGFAYDTTSVEDSLAMVRFQWICERGKAALGEGFNSAGELVPGELAALGVDDLEVFTSDKTSRMLPPYATDAEQAQVEQLEEFGGRELWIWPQDVTERYYRAGGGEPDAFAGLWATAMQRRREALEEIRAMKVAAAGGGMSYLVTARKRR